MEENPNFKQEENYSYTIKYIIVGDSSVGKSNILLRYSKNTFDPSHMTTLGIEFANKKIKYEGINYNIQVWDTAGQESFKSVTRAYYKSSACAFIVYDITNEKSFNNIENWIFDCKNLAPSKIQLFLIGNKCDLEDKRQIDYETGKNFANLHNMIFFETSALSGFNVNKAFMKSIEIIDGNIRNGFYDGEDSSLQGIRKMKNGVEVSGERFINVNKLVNGKKESYYSCCNYG